MPWPKGAPLRFGSYVVNLDGYAGHISYGNQKEYVGTIGHLDVVPAGNDWTYPAYGAEIHNNKMYGRGTEDDKGPTIAIYYALKILKELNVPLSKRIKLILGTDEETAWRGVRHYFSVYPEIPVSGFIPDADFPLIYAEKGISRIFVEGKIESKDIVFVQGGFRDNMVPDYAEAYLNQTQDFISLFKQFLKEKEMTAEDNLLMNELMEEHVHGREATHNLSDSCRSYRSGDVSALNNIVDNLRILNKLYPEHINKEDNIFFPATMKYLSEKDDYHLLTRYYEFDKKMIHEKYVSVIDACERQLSLV